jgi:hypothetical protein
MTVCSLNWQYGRAAPPTDLTCSPAATQAGRRLFLLCLRRLWSQRQRVIVERGSELVKRSSLSYTSEVVARAECLSWERVRPGLPPAELCGSIDIMKLLDGPALAFMQRPEDYFVYPESEEMLGKQGKMHFESPEEETRVIDELLKLKLLTLIPAEEIPVVHGRLILNGMFGVPKSGEEVRPGVSQLRLIMNLTMSNSVQQVWEGDIGALPCFTQWRRLYLSDDEDLSWSHEDLRGAFQAAAIAVPSVCLWAQQVGSGAGWPQADVCGRPDASHGLA